MLLIERPDLVCANCEFGIAYEQQVELESALCVCAVVHVDVRSAKCVEPDHKQGRSLTGRSVRLAHYKYNERQAITSQYHFRFRTVQRE